MIKLQVENDEGKNAILYLSRHTNIRLMEQSKMTVIRYGNDEIVVKEEMQKIDYEIWKQLEQLRIDEEMAFGTKNIRGVLYGE